MNKVLQQMAAVWNKLEITQRVTVVLVGIGFIVAAVAFSYAASQPDFRLLAGNLSQGQVAEIGAYLESLHIQYKVTDNESAVMVPSKDLYRLRNDLAEREMLGDGGNGFELLEKGNMWDSTFSEHKNYDRAVAGELERSLRELDGVRSARVIIDRPQPSPFVGNDEAQPKASIKLDMNPGVHLNDRQIAGIVHLTSGAVSGLMPERVQIMDNAGLLTANTGDTGAMAAQTSLDAEISREAHLTRKAQDLLDATLGPGRSRVKVAVKLDFTKRTEATSNPTETKTLKENSTITDEKTPVVNQGGLPGTISNIPEGETSTVNATPVTATKTSEEIHNEYVVGKKTTTQEDEIGVIKGMTVSILLDHKTPEAKQVDETGKDIIVAAVPYSDAEAQKYAQLVASAIGLNAAKGVARQKDPTAKDLEDRFKVEVQSMGMWKEKDDQVAQATMLPTWMDGGLKDYIGYCAALIVALGLLMIARSQLKRSHAAVLESEERSRKQEEERERQREGMEELGTGPAPIKRQQIKEMIRKRVQENPAAAAQIIRKWINE
jgi:flagellar M-ring protein FliF